MYRLFKRIIISSYMEIKSDYMIDGINMVCKDLIGVVLEYMEQNNMLLFENTNNKILKIVNETTTFKSD